ncbi:PQQ-dependent sugar dehydrogenase [Lysobacter silvisoli]|uniref:PQQ-dependent sugar dehydrogenase n=1 Tax=Lysobacter silvisoli TaxID=2293254 RepID=A0A371K633_9GAMM|nr:PQQ-dependent sugar dehydrogenase [Lysobacter silvisoli]RDZ29307.1 PQQ-dependent sugar dehydrogenase [Lysobacter silvisoli]
MVRYPTALSALALLLAACNPISAELAPERKDDPDAPARFVAVYGNPPAQTPAATNPQAPAADPQPLADTPPQTGGPNQAAVEPNPPFLASEFARFNEPWAMTFLPDGRLLVTEKNRRLRLFDTNSRQTSEITGLPGVAYGGQGGMGDVVLHPQFASNRYVYFSYAEGGANNVRGAVVARAVLNLNADGNGGHLSGMQVLWRQTPKVTGEGHYSHRIAFGGDGKLWITSGDRQKFDPAQDLSQNLGKVIRLNDDGSVPADNPFASSGGVAAQVWTLGHRNLLGIAFDNAGRLWTHEMGPQGGDELNLIERGTNYGWPIVSNGDHYGGAPIPDHPTRPEFNAPETWWTPVIAPAGFVIYNGDLFPSFRGHGFIGGLASMALVRIRFDGTSAVEHARYPMGARIREIEQGPDGALWVLEDSTNARLLKLTPRPY